MYNPLDVIAIRNGRPQRVWTHRRQTHPLRSHSVGSTPSRQWLRTRAEARLADIEAKIRSLESMKRVLQKLRGLAADVHSGTSDS